jgi:hypothetical protein
VLLPLLLAMLLRKVRDTLANPVCTARQRRLAILHLLFDLLAKGAVGRSESCAGRAASREHRGQDRSPNLGLYRGAHS